MAFIPCGPATAVRRTRGNLDTRRSARFQALAAALFLSLLSLWIFTHNNDFPLDYHPDERGKVQQITDPAQGRNFNHPLLLLEAANLVQRAAGAGAAERDVAILGRVTSAGLAALAVLVLALAGFRFAGWPGLWLCGAMVALCPPLDVYAHFFKEDTALVAGVAVALLGAACLVTTQGPRRWPAALLMGLGCGAAISGKYAGAVTLVPCFAALLLAPRADAPPLRPSLFGFVGATAASVVAINWRAFHGLLRLDPAASERLVDEFLHATNGHDGLALPVPNAFSLGIAASEWLPHVWLFLALGLGFALALRRCDRRIATTSAFLTAYTVALSFSAFPFPRYALPITVIGYFAAGQLAAAALARIALPKWGNRAVLAACLSLVVAAQGERCWRFDRQFGDDSRQRLREGVARHLGEQDSVLAGNFTSLEGPGDPWRYPHQGTIAAQILRPDVLHGQPTTMAQLKAAGIDYVAVAEPKYERYFRPGIHTIGYAREPDLAARQHFYRELFTRGELVWASAPSPPNHAYVDPELRLYRLPGTPPR
jgi:hypothetical protein